MAVGYMQEVGLVVYRAVSFMGGSDRGRNRIKVGSHVSSPSHGISLRWNKSNRDA